MTKIKKENSMQYYEDSEKTQLRVDLLDKDAQSESDRIVSESSNRRGRYELSSSQLRKFFYEFRNLEKRVNSVDEFKKVLPLVKMVKSKAEYFEGKNSIPRAFKEFLTDNVSSISDRRDFEAFMLYFEAIVGFCYGKPGFHK